MKTYKVTVVIKVENQKYIDNVVPSIVAGMKFDEDEGVVSVEKEECKNEQL